jgi:hypothetical protein
MIRQSGFDSQQGQEMFLFSIASSPALGLRQPLIQWSVWAVAPEAKWQTYEADHSPSSTTEVRKGETIAPLPPASSWHGAWSTNHNSKSIFILLFYSIILVIVCITQTKRTKAPTSCQNHNDLVVRVVHCKIYTSESSYWPEAYKIQSLQNTTWLLLSELKQSSKRR